MKANAPEKIYLCPSELAGIDYDEEWYDSPVGDSIEYIRKDAFIEKACEWLKNFNDFHNIMRYSDCYEVPLNRIIEGLNNYMEGE